MGLCAPKPRTARRGRRSGGTGNEWPLSLGKGLAAVASGGQIFAGMDANVLFGKALGLGSGWKVVKSEMDVAGRELKIWLDFESGSQFACRNAERSVRFTIRWRRSGGIWTFGSIALS